MNKLRLRRAFGLVAILLLIESGCARHCGHCAARQYGVG
jgi:uncharacterized protein YuzB (UPF0349 family)